MERKDPEAEMRGRQEAGERELSQGLRELLVLRPRLWGHRVTWDVPREPCSFQVGRYTEGIPSRPAGESTMPRAGKGWSSGQLYPQTPCRCPRLLPGRPPTRRDRERLHSDLLFTWSLIKKPKAPEVNTC